MTSTKPSHRIPQKAAATLAVLVTAHLPIMMVGEAVAQQTNDGGATAPDGPPVDRPSNPGNAVPNAPRLPVTGPGADLLRKAELQDEQLERFVGASINLQQAASQPNSSKGAQPSEPPPPRAP